MAHNKIDSILLLLYDSNSLLSASEMQKIIRNVYYEQEEWFELFCELISHPNYVKQVEVYEDGCDFLIDYYVLTFHGLWRAHILRSNIK